MKGTIANFRQGRHHQYDNHMIIVSDEFENREKAEKLVGKQVVFKTEANKEISGKVASAHGNKGAVRVIFEKGMPGQSVGKKVEIKA
mgnify:CR=1 FL=1